MSQIIAVKDVVPANKNDINHVIKYLMETVTLISQLRDKLEAMPLFVTEDAYANFYLNHARNVCGSLTSSCFVLSQNLDDYKTTHAVALEALTH